jgi:hypothetical protein
MKPSRSVPEGQVDSSPVRSAGVNGKAGPSRMGRSNVTLSSLVGRTPWRWVNPALKYSATVTLSLRDRSVGVWCYLRSERKSAKRCESLAQEPVGLTAQRLPSLAQGEGLAEPWVWDFGTRRSERAADRFCTGAVRANRTALDDSHRCTIGGPLCRSFRATQFLSPIPRVPPSLHPGLSSAAASPLRHPTVRLYAKSDVRRQLQGRWKRSIGPWWYRQGSWFSPI